MPLLDRLNKLLDVLRKASANIGKQIAGESWGYGHCLTENDSAIQEYKKVVETLRNQELSKTGICISKEEMLLIESNIHRIVGPECKEEVRSFGQKDSPNKTQWVLQNPGCIAYDTWSDYLYAQCQKVGIDFKVYLNKCETLSIDLKVANKKLCELVELALDVEERICSVDIVPKVNIEQCSIEFKTVVTPLKCDITLDTYVHAIKCGLDLKTVVNLLKCGATLSIAADNIDVCFPEVPGPIETLSLEYQEGDWDTFECPPGGDGLLSPPSFVIPTMSCDCLLGSEGQLGPVSGIQIDPIGITINGTPLGDIGGGFFDDIYYIPVLCGEELNALQYTIETLTPCCGDPECVCAQPPAYAFMYCNTLRITLTDPCGNTVTSEGKFFCNANC